MLRSLFRTHRSISSGSLPLIEASVPAAPCAASAAETSREKGHRQRYVF